ncbi:MAG TPA: DUF4162 domain-containing protein, partial [Vicinamibacterales bacterium]|nr:DUF4162 domain-containing protein [Vicinamibacterales bacterium]
NQRLLRELVLDEHRRGATILFSTHIMTHAEQLCDHVVMIHRGDKVLDQPVRTIGSSFDPRSIRFEPMDPAADVAPLALLPGVRTVARDAGAWDIALADGADAGSVLKAIVRTITPSRIEVRRPTLEDVFVDIVTARGAEEADASSGLRHALRDEGVEEVVR